jgi:hypothetical protein
VDPNDFRLADEVRMSSIGRYRVRLDASKLEWLARALEVEDVEVPAAWDGAVVEVSGSWVVGLRYLRSNDEYVFLQSPSPEVHVPAGVDVAELGAFALRLAGLSELEARTFARNVDWRSTVLVPIPTDGGSFREVEVNGAKGLLVTAVRKPKPGPDGQVGRGRRMSTLLWSNGARVFAVSGPGDGVAVVHLAQAVR